MVGQLGYYRCFYIYHRLFGNCCIVKYPDKLVMPAKLFTENPTVELISKVNAEIDSIYINHQ